MCGGGVGEVCVCVCGEGGECVCWGCEKGKGVSVYGGGRGTVSNHYYFPSLSPCFPSSGNRG